MNYEVKLEAFEGPLDLLLHLIESAKVDIQDIFVAKITEQYLSYMQQFSALDMDTASEFLTMAATLLYIKSRALLPRAPKEEGEAEEDPEAVLFQRLREYKAFKEASGLLEQMLGASVGRFTKLPEEMLSLEPHVEWTSGVPQELYAAFSSLLFKAQNKGILHPLHDVTAERFTIRTETKRLRDMLSRRKSMLFHELFEEHAPRLQIIVVFLSLLEMVAHGEVRVLQDAPYAPIAVSAQRLLSDDDDFDYMDE